MSRRKKAKSLYPFESSAFCDGAQNKYRDEEGRINTEVMAQIFYSMVVSRAWQDLTPRQQMLYVYAKMEFFGARCRPSKDFPDIEDYQKYGGCGCFYLNRALLVNVYGLYSAQDKNSLYDDIEELTAHGFIECVTDNRAQKKRSVYGYSSAWKEWVKGYIWQKNEKKYEWVQGQTKAQIKRLKKINNTNERRGKV